MNPKHKTLKGQHHADHIQAHLTRLAQQQARYLAVGDTHKAVLLYPDIEDLSARLMDTVHANHLRAEVILDFYDHNKR